MTADLFDLERLHAALDESPGDQATRLVLSDLYEDDGDMVMAAGLRWMAERKVTPRHDKSYDGSPEQWVWATEGPRRASLQLPASTFAALVGGILSHFPEYGSSIRRYPTRRAAEIALCRSIAGLHAASE